MTDRILDFSEQPAHLSVENGLLKIRFLAQRSFFNTASLPLPSQKDEASHSAPGGPDQPEEQTVPLADLAALVVSHPQVTYTQAVLAGLATAGGIFVACDEKLSLRP